MYICKILASTYYFIGNGKFRPPPLIPGGCKMTLVWEIAPGIKQFWKMVLRSINNRWETNLPKIIEKILILDLSILAIIV